MVAFGNLSTTLTNQLDKSLGGASPTDSINLCSPNQYKKFKAVQINENESTLNWTSLSKEKKALFIKCVLIIQYLSDFAIEEANEDLQRIIEFYSEDLTQNHNTSLPTYQTSIKPKILPAKVRPSLVLDDF
jgi:hypothetical protein